MTRHKKKPATLRPCFAVPPAQRAQHDELVVVNHDPTNISARRVQVRLPNRLRKYLALGSISEPMCQAGEALASDWDRAGLTPRCTANLMSSGGGYKNMADPQIDARDRVVAALAGDRRRYADLLVNVCVNDEGMRDTRRLRRALIALARHYGLMRGPLAK
jgi:hypothetical protein